MGNTSAGTKIGAVSRSFPRIDKAKTMAEIEKVTEHTVHTRRRLTRSVSAPTAIKPTGPADAGPTEADAVAGSQTEAAAGVASFIEIADLPKLNCASAKY